MDFFDDFKCTHEDLENTNEALSMTNPNVSNTDMNRDSILDNLVKKYRENSNMSNIIEETKDMEEDVVREITSIVNRKGKGTTADDEEEKYDFKNILSEYETANSFIDMKLSKVILKSLNDSNISVPTSIQAACIPQAMLKKDICACAKTGSGKTMAFLIPIIERLLRVPSQQGKYITPRAVIMSPTRELALQTFEVATTLLKYCPRMTVQLVTGGLNRSAQEASLRNGGDIIIATPGRLIDLVHNTPNFDLRKIEVLVLDEADKMLDDQFIDQITELVKGCSPTRQVLLFSATMTENVQSLTSLSLRDPIKVFVSSSAEVADNLDEEVVRVRSDCKKEFDLDREALLMSLVCRGFARRTIVFLPTKKLCHRIHVMLGLLGVRSGELHSNMTQAQRLEALARFGRAETSEADRLDVLVGTDLAARGIDIVDVDTVINYKLPSKLDQYVHRVGRTARNCRAGRAISLVAEAERALLKRVCKASPRGVKMRRIDPSVLEQFAARVKQLHPVVEEIIEAEKLEREAAVAELELEKAGRRLEGGEGEERDRRFNWFAGRGKPGVDGRAGRKRGREAGRGNRDGDSDDDEDDRRSHKRPARGGKSGSAAETRGRAFSKKKLKEEARVAATHKKDNKNIKFRKR